MIRVCIDYALPSSFLGKHLNHRGDEGAAAGNDDAPRDTTSYQMAALPFEPSDATAKLTGPPPRTEVRTVLTPALAPSPG